MVDPAQIWFQCCQTHENIIGKKIIIFDSVDQEKRCLKCYKEAYVAFDEVPTLITMG